MKPPHQTSGPRAALTARIRAACLQQGLNMGELARKAGVSRTTLYQIARGTTRHPRASTLCRIARALGLAPDELTQEGPSLPDGQSPGWADDDRQRARLFDRRTNTVIQTVYRNQPHLFRGWSGAEWEELYSTFGTGGELNEQGVVETAARMNRRRETVRRLQVVLETHLRPVAEKLVDTLYGMVSPHDNLQQTPQLTSLLAEHDRRPPV